MVDMQSKESSGSPGREKYWEEKNLDEKIEQMANLEEQLYQKAVNLKDQVYYMRSHHHVRGKMLFERELQGEKSDSRGGPLNRKR